MNSREQYIQTIRQRMIDDEETIIKRLIQLRDHSPKHYKQVPAEWRRAVDRYEKKKDVKCELKKRESLAKQS